jgi:hypothetical protein
MVLLEDNGEGASLDVVGRANAAAIVAAMNSLEPLLACAEALVELQDIVSSNGLAHSNKARAALQALAEGGGE